MTQRSVKLFAMVIAVLVGIVLAKDLVAKQLVRSGVKMVTGLDLHLPQLQVGLLKTAVRVRDLELRNPAGFPDPVMLTVPELYVDYNLGALLGGKVHLEEVRLHVAELVVERNTQGELNLNALQSVQAAKQDARKASTQKPAADKIPEIRIDVLALKVGKVVYRDYAGGGQPKVQEFQVNLDERYQNVTNPYLLTSLIISRALMHTTVAKLTGFDLGAIEGQVNQQLKRAKELATSGVASATSTTKEAATKATELGKDAADVASETLKGTAESIKKVIPFGE